MVKNTKGGKGHKAQSNKKIKQREEQANANERNLIEPNKVEDGTILCKIVKCVGGSYFSVESLDDGICYQGYLSRSNSRLYKRLKPGVIILVQYRLCNSNYDKEKSTVDIVTVYSDGQLNNLQNKGYISNLEGIPEVHTEEDDDLLDDDISLDDL